MLEMTLQRSPSKGGRQNDKREGNKQREKQDRVKSRAAGKVCSALALGLKRELRTEQLPGQQTEGFQRSQPQRSSGFYNGSVQPGYLRALECEKNGKTDTRARTERPCIQHLHELAIKSQQISTHMWRPPDTAALTWSQFMGTKHILLAGIITRSCDLTTNYRWKT